MSDIEASTIVQRVRGMTGITRLELAELADVSPSTISRIERGLLDPTWGTLSRILDATGYRINGDTVVSAGDSTAIAAARSVLQTALEPYRDAVSGVLEPLAGATTSVAQEVGRNLTSFASESIGSLTQPIAEKTSELARWLARWERAGWLSPEADDDAIVSMAVSAGNAAKLSRRNIEHSFVIADDGWRVLAQRLDEEGVGYAVSGLIATRLDRSTAVATSPIIYVNDLPRVVTGLNLRVAAPGAGVQLISPENDELDGIVRDGGIWFVSKTQGILDAFAGSGREPDKAEASLRDLLAVNA